MLWCGAARIPCRSWRCSGDKYAGIGCLHNPRLLYKNHICRQDNQKHNYEKTIMDFISWLVMGVLLMLTEFGFGTFYMLAVGLACIYPATASYQNAPVGIQIAALGIGGAIHALIVMMLRKRRPPQPSSNTPTDIGQRVEVIEWVDEGAARVRYRGREWDADKIDGTMPDVSHGIIRSVQYGRLVIAPDEQGKAG